MKMSYDYAKSLYSNLGVDIDFALKELSRFKISVHCWQGDDVSGFEGSAPLGGGIAATGNYIGKARNAEELMQDLDLALSLIPGKHKINLHAIYAVTGGEGVSRDALEPRHFEPWLKFAKERDLGLDINPTLFSHPLAEDGFTLSHPDEKVRRFWIEHCKAMREVGQYFGKELGQVCLNNIWIPDGLKHMPADRLSPRLRLKDSLDEIFSIKYDKNYLIDSLESKLFGIGLEAYTVGSHEFYLSYAAKNDCICLLDSGHFHPTEEVADKLSAMLLFSDKLALHVTKGIRWDSDHVVAFDDAVLNIAKEIVAADALDRVMVGLDYFDASINRVAAWVIGVRNMQKAILSALLTPHKLLGQMQERGEYTKMFALGEELKTYPLGAVWDYFCESQGVPVRENWLPIIEEYEKTELYRR